MLALPSSSKGNNGLNGKEEPEPNTNMSNSLVLSATMEEKSLLSTVPPRTELAISTSRAVLNFHAHTEKEERSLSSVWPMEIGKRKGLSNELMQLCNM